MSKTAIIIGATGLTGGLVLDQLLSNENYSRVKVFVRRSTGRVDAKLEEHIVDLHLLEDVKEEFIADELYCCIGTTRKKTPDREEYFSIDYGIPVAASRIAKENGVEVMAVVSAVGANPSSSVFYNRTKGEMERDVLSVGIEHTYILRPSIIGGERHEKRLGERIGQLLFKILNPLFIGKMKRYRLVQAEDIALRMIELCNSDQPTQIVESEDIPI